MQVVAEDVVVATKNGSSIGIAFVEFKHYQDAERMQVCVLHYCHVDTVVPDCGWLHAWYSLRQLS